MADVFVNSEKCDDINYISVSCLYISKLNYLYLKRCVESAPLAHMSTNHYDHMLQLIPKSLQTAYPEILSDIHTEVMAEYDKSMQKSMGKEA
jgi:hypothetical protein